MNEEPPGKENNLHHDSSFILTIRHKVGAIGLFLDKLPLIPFGNPFICGRFLAFIRIVR